MSGNNCRRQVWIVVLTVLLTVESFWIFFRDVQAAAQTELDLERWAAKIHAGWLGKVAAGSGTLKVEMKLKRQAEKACKPFW